MTSLVNVLGKTLYNGWHSWNPGGTKCSTTVVACVGATQFLLYIIELRAICEMVGGSWKFSFCVSVVTTNFKKKTLLQPKSGRHFFLEHMHGVNYGF